MSTSPLEPPPSHIGVLYYRDWNQTGMHDSVPKDHQGYHVGNHNDLEHVHADTPGKVKVLNVLTYYLIIVGTFYLYSVSFILNQWDESEEDVSEFRHTATKPKEATKDHGHLAGRRRQYVTVATPTSNSSPGSTDNLPSRTVAYATKIVQAKSEKPPDSTERTAMYQAKDVSHPAGDSRTNGETKEKTESYRENSQPDDASTNLPFETFPGLSLW